MTSISATWRRFHAIAVGLVTVGFAALAVACGDSPSGPVPRSLTSGADASYSVAGAKPEKPTKVKGLTWTKEVSEVTERRVIGPDGGTISIPAGIRITVPKGAVSSPVAFSVTRLAGKVVAYSFEPHGTTFAVPLLIEQPTLGTNLMKLPPVSSIEGAYFSELNQISGIGVVTEFEPTFVSADKAWIRFTVKHFSGYMVSTGRESDDQ